jgi:hypothetical protein
VYLCQFFFGEYHLYVLGTIRSAVELMASLYTTANVMTYLISQEMYVL